MRNIYLGIMKSVPKYMTAVIVKDYMEATLPICQPDDTLGTYTRAAIKSVTAGVAGAVLTNPCDVIRNEYVSLHYCKIL